MGSSMERDSMAMAIQPPHCFPCCVVWTPLPLLAWLFPLVGHAGIGMSNGTILDFAGPYLVNDQGLAFGHPTMYFRLNLLLAEELRDADSTEDRLAGYDKALRRARLLYERQMYSPANNCYQFVSHCLNVLGYRGRRHWNMVYLALEFCRHARFLGVAACVKSWGPFLVLFPLAVYFGGLVAVYTWAAFIALLLAMIFFYSFFVYDAAKLLYMTPKVVQPA